MNRVLFVLYTSLSTCIYACLISLWRSECEVHYVVMLFTVGLHYNYYRVFLSLKWLLFHGVDLDGCLQNMKIYVQRNEVDNKNLPVHFCWLDY